MIFILIPPLNEYEALKAELHSIYDRKGKAAMFRSNCRWIEKGEKPTKYFFNLEKINYNRKTIDKLRKQDGVEIREEKEILNVIQEFYADLYSSEISTSQAKFDGFIKKKKKAFQNTWMKTEKPKSAAQNDLQLIYTIRLQSRILGPISDLWYLVYY